MTAWGRGLETELRLAQEALASLKAETVRKLEEAIPPVETYIGKLEAENKRLRKAGDAVIEKLAEAYAGDVSEFDHAHVFKAWIEAKESRP
jgi:hypothetical protein